MKNIIKINEGIFLNLKLVSKFEISKEDINLELIADYPWVTIKVGTESPRLGPSDAYTVPINEYKRIEREINEFINHKI